VGVVVGFLLLVVLSVYGYSVYWWREHGLYGNVKPTYKYTKAISKDEDEANASKQLVEEQFGSSMSTIPLAQLKQMPILEPVSPAPIAAPVKPATASASAAAAVSVPPPAATSAAPTSSPTSTAAPAASSAKAAVSSPTELGAHQALSMAEQTIQPN